jgi:hypothetical protein
MWYNKECNGFVIFIKVCKFSFWIKIMIKILNSIKAILTKKQLKINVFKNEHVSFLSFLLSLNFRKHDLKSIWNENFIPLMHAPVLTSHLVPGGQCSHPSLTIGSCSIRRRYLTCNWTVKLMDIMNLRIMQLHPLHFALFGQSACFWHWQT